MQVAKMYLITNITIYDVIAVRLVCAPVLLHYCMVPCDLLLPSERGSSSNSKSQTSEK